MQELTKKVVDKNMLLLWFIWGQVFFSLIVYVWVCRYWLGNQKFMASQPMLRIENVRCIFYFAAAVVLALSYYLRISILRLRPGKPESKFMERAERSNKSPIIIKYNTAVIASVPVAGAPAIVGMELFLFTGGKGIQDVYVLALVSFAAILFLRPKRKELERLSIQWAKVHNASYPGWSMPV